MAQNTGTLVSGAIRPNDSADTFPTAYANELKGGLMSVADNTERDAIPTARRQVGLEVYCADSGTVYQLHGGITNSDWRERPGGAGGGTAADIEFTPYGGIEATNVQTALQELADEKLTATVLPVFNLVVDFGADNTGVNSINSAFAAMLAAVPAKSTIIVPAGVYRITGQITITKPLTIVGAGWVEYECYHQRLNDEPPSRITYDDYTEEDGTIFYVDFTPTTEVYSALRFMDNGITISGVEFFSYQGNPGNGNSSWVPTVTPFAIEVVPNGAYKHFSRGCSINNVMIRNLSRGILVSGAFQTNITKLRAQCWDVVIYVNCVYDTQFFNDISIGVYWSDNVVAYSYQFDYLHGIIISRADGPQINGFFMLRGYCGIKTTGLSPAELEYPFPYNASDYDNEGDGEYATPKDSYFLNNAYIDNTRYAMIFAAGSGVPVQIICTITTGFHDEIRTPWYGRGIWVQENVAGTLMLSNFHNWNSKYETIRIDGSGLALYLTNCDFRAWDSLETGCPAIYLEGGNTLLASNVSLTSPYTGAVAFDGTGQVIGCVSVDGNIGTNYANPAYEREEVYTSIAPISKRLERTTPADGTLAGATSFTGINFVHNNDNAPTEPEVTIIGAAYTARHRASSGTLPYLYSQYNSTRLESAATVTTAGCNVSFVTNAGTGTITNAIAYYARTPVNSGGGAITNAYGMLIEEFSAGTNKWAVYSNGSMPTSMGGLIESRSGGFKFPDGTTQTSAASNTLTFSEQSESFNAVAGYAYSIVGSNSVTVSLPDISTADLGKLIAITNLKDSSITIDNGASDGILANGALAAGSITLPVYSGITLCAVTASGNGNDYWCAIGQSEADDTGSTVVSDTAYGSGWNGDTTTAPSKNAVYDKIEAVVGTIPTATSASDGQVLYSNGTNNSTGASGLLWDDTNSRIGIGTTTPQYRSHIEGTAASSALQLIRQHANATTGGGGGIYLYHNDTSSALPANGTRLGYIAFGAFDTDGTTARNGALIRAVTTAAWGASDRGCDLIFETTASGSTTRTSRLNIKNTGAVRFVPLSSAPTTAEIGDMYVDTAGVLYICTNATGPVFTKVGVQT